MSDSSQGEGWWQASDTKWYPPDQHPDAGQQQTQPVDQSGPPTQATPPPTQAMPPAPPPAPPGGPPTSVYAPPGGPPAAPAAAGVGGPDGPGSNNTKWIVAGAIAVAIIAIAAFLIFRSSGSNNNKTATVTSDGSSSANTDSSSSKSSSSSTSSSSSRLTVDPNTAQDKLLTASDFPSSFTEATFTPSTTKTDPCGNPTSESKFPPTKDIGVALQDTTASEFFQQEVEFYPDAATTKKAFDFAVNGLKNCTSATIVGSDSSSSSFTVSSIKDVSTNVGFNAVEVQAQINDISIVEVGVQLDNAFVTYLFQFPTSAGQSAVPDAIGIAKKGTQQLLS